MTEPSKEFLERCRQQERRHEEDAGAVETSGLDRETLARQLSVLRKETEQALDAIAWAQGLIRSGSRTRAKKHLEKAQQHLLRAMNEEMPQPTQGIEWIDHSPPQPTSAEPISRPLVVSYTGDGIRDVFWTKMHVYLSRGTGRVGVRIEEDDAKETVWFGSPSKARDVSRAIARAANEADGKQEDEVSTKPTNEPARWTCVADCTYALELYRPPQPSSQPGVFTDPVHGCFVRYEPPGLPPQISWVQGVRCHTSKHGGTSRLRSVRHGHDPRRRWESAQADGR
jgi:hypothetical protein